MKSIFKRTSVSSLGLEYDHRMEMLPLRISIRKILITGVAVKTWHGIILQIDTKLSIHTNILNSHQVRKDPVRIHTQT